MDIGFQSYLQFLLALVFVLALFGALVLLARRYGIGHRMATRPNATRRLGLVEVMALDSKRRLVLLRRDDTEHLLVLGPEGQTVVESGIRELSPRDFAAHLQSAGGDTAA